jgi:hypothetical protein
MHRSPYDLLTPIAFGILMRKARSLEKSDKGAQVAPSHVSKLPFVASPNRPTEFIEQGNAGPGNPDLDGAAIVGRPAANNEAPLFELVEQAGDVRRPRDKPTAKRDRGHTPGMPSTQEPQRVILLSGQAMAAKEDVLQGSELVVRSPQVQEGFLFEGIKSPRGLLPCRFSPHSKYHNRFNKICLNKFISHFPGIDIVRMAEVGSPGVWGPDQPRAALA